MRSHLPVASPTRTSFLPHKCSASRSGTQTCGGRNPHLSGPATRRAALHTIRFLIDDTDRFEINDAHCRLRCRPVQHSQPQGAGNEEATTYHDSLRQHGSLGPLRRSNQGPHFSIQWGYDEQWIGKGGNSRWQLHRHTHGCHW